MISFLVKRTVQTVLKANSFSLDDVSEVDNHILQSVQAFTMTSPERVYSVLEAVRYVLKSGLPGSIVECGVWRGGIMMAVALLLKMNNIFDKELYLFDSFEGMPLPADVDTDFRGRKAMTDFLAHAKAQRLKSIY